ncbi:lysozyme C-like [Pseudophryne corroboree]|uniref:lysozyme C-like n=1 Tax=Pseudophryne corroboree TaxID=495146 RepID=UPI003081F41B
MTDDLLANFMCIAEHASQFNILNQKSPGRYGIFQIGDEEWCQNEKCGSKNLCDMPCSYLQDSNLNDDIQCAIKINKLQGFTAWPEWVANCQGKDLTLYTQGC